MESRRRGDKLAALLGLCLAPTVVLGLAGCEDAARNLSAYHPSVVRSVTTQQRNSAAKLKQSPGPAFHRTAATL